MSRVSFASIMAGFLATVCASMFVAVGCEQHEAQCDDGYNIVTPSDPLPNHEGKYVIESIYGVVLNDNGDGRIVNTDSDYNYIHYDMSLGFKVGDVVQSVCVYNPRNNAEDDIIYRDDFVVEQGQYQLIEEGNVCPA